MADIDPLAGHPFDTFGPWFRTPLRLPTDRSVRGIVDALNAHPLAGDQHVQDYVMPARRYLEKSGRFRIWGENQDCYYCWVRADQAGETDPPVYFESHSFNLVTDAHYDAAEIVDGDSVLVCPRFTQFLWHMLGHYFCLRAAKSPLFAGSVTGVQFSVGTEIESDGTFVMPLGREFPAGYTPFIGPDAVCIPDWGAAFLNEAAHRAFCARHDVPVDDVWPAEDELWIKR
jgi:hypothetical protein